MSEDRILLVMTIVVLTIMGVVYVIPSIIAFRRKHPNRWIILVVNLAFGGTIIGWGVALVWALQAVHRIDDQTSGGESGLNLFINDPKTVRVLPSQPGDPSSLAAEIERLHTLTIKGALTESEFGKMKTQLIKQAAP